MRIVALAFLTVTCLFLMIAGVASVKSAEASRESCECRELRAIRILLEHQSGLVCDERHCEPIVTPTPNGSELP